MCFSVASDHSHELCINLLGVSLHPMALVLEFAPLGELGIVDTM